MEGLASKRTELKIELLQDLENILSAGVCVHFSAPEIFTCLGSEGVKSNTQRSYCLYDGITIVVRQFLC